MWLTQNLLQSIIESPVERARDPIPWQRNARQCFILVAAETLTDRCRTVVWISLMDYLRISRTGSRYRVG